MSNTPGLGRVVHVLLRPGMEDLNNGSLDAAGFIVRAWGPIGAPGAEFVNVKVAADAPEDLLLRSINLFPTKGEALDYQAVQTAACVAYWPAR